MPSITNEFRHAARRLMRAPGFTAITLATLAIGIGANTAIFSVVNGVLLNPLPYPEPDRLVGIWETAPGLNFPRLNASPATYFTFREENRTFEDVGMWQGGSVSVTGVGDPEQLSCLLVTEGTLPILGVKPVIGRLFDKKDDSHGAPETVILTYGYWQKRFGGDPSVVGRKIRVNGRLQEIIGVLPRDFRFMNRDASLLLPLQIEREKVFIGNFSYQSLARLKPGVTLAQANADVARMLPMMLGKFPPAPGMSLKMFEEIKLGPDLRPLKHDVVGDAGKILWVLMGTVALVLLIACANVANLMLVRAEGRQHELAIRAALGAGWRRIARELLMESVALGLCGGVLGLGVAYGALRALVTWGPTELPRIGEISIDGSVLIFTLVISLFAGVLFGLLPVFKYAGASLIGALRQGGRSVSEGRERHRARSILVVVQVALALVLLVSSGLMIRTFQAMRQVEPGFTNPEQIQTLRLAIQEAAVPKAEQVAATHQEIVRKLEAIPGVTSVALVNAVTMDGWDNNDPIFVEDRTYREGELPPIRRYKHISPGVFKTMGNPMLAGRDLTWTDVVEKRKVVIVSENLAREYWGSAQAALGKRVRENPKNAWREIIGVVANERDDGADRPAPAVVYWPLLLENFWDQPIQVRRNMAYLIRSSRAGTLPFMNEVRQAVWSVNRDLPLAQVRTVKEIYDRSMQRTSFTLAMLALAGAMALLLGLVGVYGVISYSVSQRTREIGIRMALGAQHDKVRGMFLRHGLLLSGIGVVVGLGAALALSKLMSALLFGVSRFDPATYVAVSIVLVGAAALASYLPARRATAVDPVYALRAE